MTNIELYSILFCLECCAQEGLIQTFIAVYWDDIFSFLPK